MIGKRLSAALASVAVALGVMAAPATAAPAKPVGQPSIGQLKEAYGPAAKASKSVVIDSNLSVEQALGDSVVPEQYQDEHAAMKPYLRVVRVLYWGYETNPKVHLGQIVVHRDLVHATNELFIGMFLRGFPINKVVPQSQYGYSDAASMADNNTSNYRPERLSSGNPSEHLRAIAFDINPFNNPFMVLQDDGTWFVDPPGAVYDPAAKGTILKFGTVRILWRDNNWEWGGNWGDVNADPPNEFFLENFFDYQHFQPNAVWYCSVQLPPGLETCPNGRAASGKPTKAGYDLAA